MSDHFDFVSVHYSLQVWLVNEECLHLQVGWIHRCVLFLLLSDVPLSDVWMVEIWILKTEKIRFMFEKVYIWPLAACALGFDFCFKKWFQFSFYQLAMAWHHNSVPIDRACLNLNDLLMSFLWILHHHQQCDNFQGGCKEL